MALKAWVMTSEDGTIVDAVSARKKIGFVDDYLCLLYARLYGGNPADLKASVARASEQKRCWINNLMCYVQNWERSTRKPMPNSSIRKNPTGNPLTQETSMITYHMTNPDQQIAKVKLATVPTVAHLYNDNEKNFGFIIKNKSDGCSLHMLPSDEPFTPEAVESLAHMICATQGMFHLSPQQDKVYVVDNSGQNMRSIADAAITQTASIRKSTLG